jgi:antirestriction protein
MTISIEDLKTELIEMHSEDEVNSFIEEFDEKNLKHFDAILEAKNKLLKHTSLPDEEATAAVVEYIENFSVLELDSILDSYNGRYESLLEFATQLFDDCYSHEIPPRLRIYIDYQKFCDDIEFDYLITKGGIVFCKN